MIRPFAILSLLLLAARPSCADTPYLWIEAEQATAQHDIVANSGLNTINPNALSGGAWLSSFSEPAAATAGSAEYNACTLRKSWGTLGDPDQSGTLLLFFDPALQQGYRAWLKALYGRPNPYTGVRLADDPAVAVIQLQNENSLLFWDLNSLKGKPQERLRGLYKDFLVAKYGSMESCRKAWQDYNPPTTEIKLPMEWDKGLPGWADVWDFSRAGMTKKGPWPGFQRCSADQAEFL